MIQYYSELFLMYVVFEISKAQTPDSTSNSFMVHFFSNGVKHWDMKHRFPTCLAIWPVGNRPHRRSREFRKPFSALWLNPHQETGKSGSLPSFTLSAPWEVVCHFLHSVITVSRLFASGYRSDDPITRRFRTRFHAFTRH